MSSYSFSKYAFVAACAPVVVECTCFVWKYITSIRSNRSNIYNATHPKHTQEFYTQNGNITRFKHPVFDSTEYPHRAMSVVNGNQKIVVVWIRDAMMEVRTTFFVSLPEIIDAFLFLEPLEGILSIQHLPYVHPDHTGFA